MHIKRTRNNDNIKNLCNELKYQLIFKISKLVNYICR